jgi:hypothetical protein
MHVVKFPCEREYVGPSADPMELAAPEKRG